MHGLINTAIETFVTRTYGQDVWEGIVADVGLDPPEFNPLLHYEDAVTAQVLSALETRLGRPAQALLEDLGTYLISSPAIPAIRRLLRFGGETYADFLLSMDELPDRARVTVDDLHLPDLKVDQCSETRFELWCGPGLPGFDHVLLGVLRAMADEFGALAILDHHEADNSDAMIAVEIVQDAFSEGRAFELGAVPA